MRRMFDVFGTMVLAAAFGIGLVGCSEPEPPAPEPTVNPEDPTVPPDTPEGVEIEAPPAP